MTTLTATPDPSQSPYQVHGRAAADRRAFGLTGGFATARLTPRTAAGRSALACLIADARIGQVIPVMDGKQLTVT